MALTDKISVLTQYQVNLLVANAGSLGIALLTSGLPSVFYGDQGLIPVTPTVCVVSGPMQRSIGKDGSGFRADIEFQQFFMIYHGQVQDVQVNKKECEQFTEAVTTLLHSDKTMGGNTIHGWVETEDPGMAIRGGTLMQATRISWRGISQAAY